MTVDEIEVPIRVVRDGAVTPKAMTQGSAGVDLSAAADATLEPGDVARVPTGLAVAIPDGFEGQLRPRSGLALKHGLGLLNSPGTIDSDYRGELCVIMVNLGRERYRIRRGDRIAQMVFQRVVRPVFVEQTKLPETNRGDGGFGHTGS